MSINQSSEINKVNIPENIPNIYAIFFTNNSVLYKREYPLNVTFGEILSDFERNIQNEELINKIEYSYKNEKINKEDKVLDKVTPFPNCKLLDIEIRIDISNIDLPQIGDEKLIYKTIIIPQGENNNNDNSESKPFRLIVYKPEEGRITIEKYSKEKNVQFALNDYSDDSSSFCNSNNSLYMSGGERENKPTKDFWKISHNRNELEYTQMPCCKKNHSMIYIPNNCVFIVGGNSKNTFYYDINKDIFCKWGELNNIIEKPALAFVDNRYLYSFPSDSCEFERSDLKSNPSWENITPIMKDNCQFNLKNYNVGVDKDGNIILYGGDNENDENGYYYIYNPKNNEMKESMGFNKNVISKNKQFYPINNYNSVLFPKNFEEDNSIYVMKKNGNVQPFNFNIEENEKYMNDYIDYKDPTNQINGKLIIKTREEIIPKVNDEEELIKNKNKEIIDYSILFPYLKGIIKDLKEKEEIKKKEEEAGKPEEVGDDNIIENEIQIDNLILDSENPTVLKSKNKWNRTNKVNFGFPKLVKKSKELEKIDDLERDNRKEEDMGKIEMEVEPKKEQEEVIKQFPIYNEDNNINSDKSIKDSLKQKPDTIQNEMKGEIPGNKEKEGKKGQNPKDNIYGSIIDSIGGEYELSGEISGDIKSSKIDNNKSKENINTYNNDFSGEISGTKKTEEKFPSQLQTVDIKMDKKTPEKESKVILEKTNKHSKDNNSLSNSQGDVKHKSELGKGIKNDEGNILTLTQLMSLNVNDEINLDDNWEREKKLNKYGGYEINIPDYHLVYENRIEEKEGNINIEGNDDIYNEGERGNIKGVRFKINDDEDLEDIDLDEGEYNVEIDNMGYAKPLNFDVDIPKDLNSIQNSKVKKRIHNPENKESSNYSSKSYNKNSLKISYLPGYNDDAFDINYTKRPTFHYTINQKPNEDIPLCYQWDDYDFNINLVADYKP